METIAVFGGSFNPVHIGHMALAQYVCSWGYADRVWLNLSPQNPLKDGKSLADDTHRLKMLEIATAEAESDIEVCDIELTMPRPSYTIDTLRRLRELYPDKRFKILIGSDNWLVFDRWRAADEIIRDFGVLVYPRPGYDTAQSPTPPRNVEFIDSPVFDISSTFIRHAIADGRNVNFFVPAGVYRYIIENRLYQTT